VQRTRKTILRWRLLSRRAVAYGKRSVYVPVTKRADASTLDVAIVVKNNLSRFQGVLPADVTVTYELDQSPYVTDALVGLPLEGAIGAGLAGLMVFLFLPAGAPELRPA
jgi:multidrug efflux pump subunit AcrB